MNKGSLTIIGSGIKAAVQFTLEGEAALLGADKVFYGVRDPFTEEFIKKISPDAESLDACYREGKPRLQTYGEMIEIVLSRVRAGLHVLVCVEGHPGVFVFMTHEMIRIAKNEGFKARMLPGIAAHDALFCDFLVDPGERGCQMFESTDFLLRTYRPDTTSMLILWQPGCIGEHRYTGKTTHSKNLAVLEEMLLQFYGKDHLIQAYEAAVMALCPPVIKSFPLSELHQQELAACTLFVPPKSTPILNLDLCQRLNLAPEDTKCPRFSDEAKTSLIEN